MNIKFSRNIIISILLALIAGGIVLAGYLTGLYSNKGSTNYIKDMTFDKGDYNAGYQVKNNDGTYNYFVPTKTEAEWDAFISGKPSTLAVNSVRPGGWSDTYSWTYGPCSKSCGGGTKTKTGTRTCTNPAPAYGGANCSGSATTTSSISCNTQRCAINGACSATKNTCTKGTVEDNTPNSSNQWQWSCVGVNGGSTASCSRPISCSSWVRIYDDNTDDACSQDWCLHPNSGRSYGHNNYRTLNIPSNGYYKFKFKMDSDVDQLHETFDFYADNTKMCHVPDNGKEGRDQWAYCSPDSGYNYLSAGNKTFKMINNQIGDGAGKYYESVDITEVYYCKGS